MKLSSDKEKNGRDVSTEKLQKRLLELSKAVTQGRDAVMREFTMSIPAELDRDADLVLSEAADRLNDFGNVLFETINRPKGVIPDAAYKYLSRCPKCNNLGYIESKRGTRVYSCPCGGRLKGKEAKNGLLSIEALLAEAWDGRRGEHLSPVENIVFHRLMEGGYMRIRNGVIFRYPENGKINHE